MAELPQDRQCHLADLRGVERTQHRDEPVLRRAKLPRILAPGLLDVDERSGHRAQVAVGRAEDPGDAVDGSGRRVVGHEVHDELRRDESGCRGDAAQIADRSLALGDAILGVAHTEHVSGARLMERLLEGEADRRPAILQPIHRPAGQDSCQLLHILLGVAAVDAERVQLQQFSRVVLVESALSTPAAPPCAA